MNWGFKIQKDNQIDFDKNDLSLYRFISEYEPSFKACIACGSCAGTCSAGLFSYFSLRKINLLIARGETASLRNELKNCMLCGKCSLVCPRGVNTRNVIMGLQKFLNQAIS